MEFDEHIGDNVWVFGDDFGSVLPVSYHSARASNESVLLRR